MIGQKLATNEEECMKQERSVRVSSGKRQQ